MKYIVLKDGTKKYIKPTQLMGIINVTPDSFYAGSRVSSVEDALQKAEEMVQSGASFLDIGGESTRPGSLPVTPEEEAERICPVIRAVKNAWPDVLVSADTYHAYTAKAAIEAGADIINDISGLTFDPDMIEVIASAGVPVVIMHIKGTPEHMQDDPQYDDVVEEVYSFLEDRVNAAVAGGIARDKIMIDLGIGFGKTAEHNITLLQNIRRFDDLGLPHLMAVSRKTFIGKLLGSEDAPLPPSERLFGTTGTTIYARMQNIEAVRVHDVKENAQALRVFEALNGSLKTKAVIALGSNMGDRNNYLERAIEQMDLRAGKVLKRSSILETKAYGYTDQADFLNMAVLLETELSPHDLLDVLHEIEAELDRVRLIHWGPRTIDLDIIFYGDQILNDPDLIIPHADYRNRSFVLTPLLEIVPDYEDPVTHIKIRDMT